MSHQHGMEPDDDDILAMSDLALVPESASRHRADLLPPPSENVRHILGELDLPAEPADGSTREYLPTAAVSWIVDVRLAGDPPLDPKAIAAAFDQEWRSEFGRFMAYGRDVKTGRWTYLISADGPERVDQLKLAFDFIDPLDPEAPPSDERRFEQRLEQIAARLQPLGQPTVTPNASPAEAAERALLLSEIRDTCDVTACLILQAPAGKRYDGRQVWDALLCLGLEWGDMDCFHCRNRSDLGDDSFFSVETSTPPGYFLPERVAAGELHVADLVFVYSVPRCARPVEVFDAMARAVQYCQSRLGGTLMNEEGEPADLAALRAQIAAVADRLHAAGFSPGGDAALQLF